MQTVSAEPEARAWLPTLLPADKVRVARPHSPRSLIKWPGGKWYLKHQILPHINAPEVVSPFLGGGHVEMELSRRGVRVHGYDIYRPLILAWDLLLNAPDTLADGIAEVAGATFPLPDDRAQALIDLWHRLGPESSNTETAIALFAQSKLAYGSMVGARRPRGEGWYGGVRQWLINAGTDANIRNFSAPNLSAECLDYREALARHPNTFAYLDPPYRIADNIYGVKGQVHAAFDHDEFAEHILSRPGPWALSYNDCPEVRETFGGFEVTEIPCKQYRLGKNERLVNDKKELLIIRGLTARYGIGKRFAPRGKLLIIRD